MIFEGYCPAIVTPFNKSGKTINYEVFKKLIDYQINNGASAIVFLGTTGEATTLSDTERKNVVKFAVDYVNKKVPVIIGAGSNNTLTAIKYSKMCEKLGATALLHVTPYYNKATQNGLYLHYKKIANSTNLPIIIYNVPSRTGTNIKPQTVAKLSYIKNIVGIKEASGNLEQIMEIRNLTDKNFAIYSGDDSLYLPSLSVGGNGIISVTGNILPKEFSEIYKYFKMGKIDNALNIQLKLFSLIKLMFVEVNPIPIKFALSETLFDVGNTRLPLCKLEKENAKKIRAELKKFF